MNTIQATGHPPTEVGHIGSIFDVIEARIPTEISSLKLHASRYKMGFELATPRDLSSLGEAVLINQLCYTNSTDQTSKDYAKPIYGEQFISGGMFLIPHEAQPSHHVQVKQPCSLLGFYDFLCKKIISPICYAGIFHFSHLHTIAIGKAPIGGKNIFKYKEEYYPFPSQKRADVFAFVIGVLSKFQHEESLKNSLNTILYRNPLDQDSSLIHHAHCLILNKQVHHIKDIQPSDVEQVHHLFAEGTEITSGHGDLFSIKKIVNYAENIK